MWRGARRPTEPPPHKAPPYSNSHPRTLKQYHSRRTRSHTRPDGVGALRRLNSQEPARRYTYAHCPYIRVGVPSRLLSSSGAQAPPWSKTYVACNVTGGMRLCIHGTATPPQDHPNRSLRRINIPAWRRVAGPGPQRASARQFRISKGAVALMYPASV